MAVQQKDTELQQALLTLSNYIATNKLRKTKEREDILTFVYSNPGHWEANEIFGMMKEAGFAISRMSVFNTLELLVKCQLVICHHFDNGAAKYEKLAPSTIHFHRICTQCGAIKEFTDKKLHRLLSKKEFTAFTPTFYKFYIYGLCKKCLNSNNLINNPQNNKQKK